MIVEHKLVNSTMYFGLRGELDSSNAADVRERMDSALDRADIKRVVVDLSRLDFMDSTGVGILLGRYKKAIKLGVQLLLASPNKSVDKVLSLSGIYEIMPKISL